MAKESADKVTPDLFQTEKRPGRPRTNPLPREQQLRLNKRRQLQRDKAKGLRRVELKLTQDMYDTLTDHAEAQGISRGALIEQLLKAALKTE
ncbi:LexA regulated protein [Aliidiomarina sanyensis]|uniref:LexA regulated protein n=1 Tax=Aliidiomarina sanyensis TaxID=1249555 RepID=A0A432WN26_9GAMM|nr:LexA regulated protein [Aliidiomarina sanyensis]RUO35206.1 LexA regulated protein [Aliidiomarina sanyensis]